MRCWLGVKQAQLFSRCLAAMARLRLRPFAEDKIVLVAPIDHPFAQRGTVELADLAAQPFVEREGARARWRA